MSATNRGATRRESDYYRTPPEAINTFLDNFQFLIIEDILEPCAGDGAIIKAIRARERGYYITAVEIRDETENLIESGADQVFIDDFLTFPGLHPVPGTIITNPPYSIAQEIIEHCFEIAPDAEVIMLLRLAFLESKKRKPFWDKYPVTQLYVLSERPSFTGKGTDATAYAWFVWSKYREPKIQVI